MAHDDATPTSVMLAIVTVVEQNINIEGGLEHAKKNHLLGIHPSK